MHDKKCRIRLTRYCAWSGIFIIEKMILLINSNRRHWSRQRVSPAPAAASYVGRCTGGPGTLFPIKTVKSRSFASNVHGSIHPGLLKIVHQGKR